MIRSESPDVRLDGGQRDSSSLRCFVTVRARNVKYLHHLVSEVVDDLDSDAAGLRSPERPRCVAVQRRPGVGVDLRLQRRPERLVRVVGAEEVCLADEEALVVVVRVDELAGDAVGAVAPNLAGAGVEDVDAVDLHLHPPGLGVVALDREDLDVGLTEDDEEVALARVGEVVGHMEVGVHAGL